MNHQILQQALMNQGWSAEQVMELVRDHPLVWARYCRDLELGAGVGDLVVRLETAKAWAGLINARIERKHA